MPPLKYPRWALTLLATAQLIIALDATIIFVALHDMGRALQINAQQLQWVVSAYTVAFGGSLLLGGRAADLIGRRRFYRLGMLLFALASLLGALAPNATWLIIARAAQGIGAALLFPATLALINTLYAEGPVRNRALAIWSMASAVGLALGTLLGGVLTQAFGWPAVLAVIVPLATACAVAAGAWLPADGPRVQGRSFDLAGCLTVTAGGSLLVTTLVQGPEWGWTAPATLICLLLSAVLLTVFVQIEKRSRDPLMQFALLRLPGLRAALGLTFAFMSSYGVQYYFLALYFQDGYGWSPLQAGMAFLLPTLVCTFGIRIAERMLRRRSPRQVLAWGFAAGAIGIAAVALAMPHGAGYWPLLPGIVVLSVGQGMSWTAMWIVAGQGVPGPQQGVASGMAATAQQIGGALGLAVLVMVANAARGTQAATSADALQGMVNAQYGAAMFAALGVVIALGLRPAPVESAAAVCPVSEA
ncbi:MFS transporter [Stenotrophomonas maltophilia]|uniref:MFS transporter n=1 Tax=Stenotrophomonas maltophilia TaxID=40324 RepID=UPI000B4E2773|nr:MFS transporter [Stenotrophomonas maltophilia]MPS45676.1 MFS transporter [Stenotrophomonas sp.]MBA0386071.1 MFS transporter [Stenotrophomonas maltophilia]MBN4992998.1 MFS transporter [Stenotrophomonas maltophilia]MBN5021269.1 MFS transporter [Stenotrophomonas maltophilia]MCI1130652.1 MFS transporter [Stenotrophomonas maltophilia]